MDWEEFLEPLKDCPQDPIHHAEGDVAIHTRMVIEWLEASEKYRALDETSREIVFWACLLHDVAKPECTRTEPDGRISARHHSMRGAILARKILWRRNLPYSTREQICNLIRFHQLPFFLVERDDGKKRAIEVSLSARCDQLALVAEADASGRRCADQQKLLDNIELFRALCEEENCLSRAYEFPSAHARFHYLARGGTDPQYRPYEEFRSEVILMSGLPGAGKDHLIASEFNDWNVVSLDRVRGELEIAPDENQAGVIAHARDEARVHLRRGGRMIWNATNLSRQLRGPLISLFADYGARVRIVYVEAPAEKLFDQNRAREARVPKNVIERMMDRWEVPTLAEAHEVEHRIS
jgi:putative nucleotidyltransferase with HDIG domain